MDESKRRRGPIHPGIPRILRRECKWKLFHSLHSVCLLIHSGPSKDFFPIKVQCDVLQSFLEPPIPSLMNRLLWILRVVNALAPLKKMKVCSRSCICLCQRNESYRPKPMGKSLYAESALMIYRRAWPYPGWLIFVLLTLGMCWAPKKMKACSRSCECLSSTSLLYV
jgi:hypothetical protein